MYTSLSDYTGIVEVGCDQCLKIEKETIQLILSSVYESYHFVYSCPVRRLSVWLIHSASSSANQLAKISLHFQVKHSIAI